MIKISVYSVLTILTYKTFSVNLPDQRVPYQELPSDGGVLPAPRAQELLPTGAHFPPGDAGNPHLGYAG